MANLLQLTAEELKTMIGQLMAEALATQNQAQANHGGQVNCSFKKFKECGPHAFNGTEGVVGVLRWMEKVESVFEMCNCPAEDRVKYASGTFEGGALTWWNIQKQLVGLTNANAMSWADFKTQLVEEYCPRNEIEKLETEFWNLRMEGSEVQAYTTRSQELALLCPSMVEPPSRRIERYITGLVPQIQGHVTAAKPANIQEAVQIAFKLTDQAIAAGTLPAKKSIAGATENKRKLEQLENNNNVGKIRKVDNNNGNAGGNQGNANQGGRGKAAYVGNYPKCNTCGYHHTGGCDKHKCFNCGRMGHEARVCRTKVQNQQNQPAGNQMVCFQCGEIGHFRKDCPQLGRNEA